MTIHKRIVYRSFVFLSFLFLFFIINSNSVFAADFKINVGSTEWKINSDGIYKNDSKIACSDIQTGSIPDNGFLVKNSSGTKLFLIAQDNIYVSAMDSFESLTYPGSLTSSFILKKQDNDVLLYVDSSGLHYKEGMCEFCYGPPDPCSGRPQSHCNYGCSWVHYCSWAAEDLTQSNCDTCGSWLGDDDCVWYTYQGGGTSFLGDTRIDTLNGYKLISNIKKGDIVKSYDIKNNKIIFSDVAFIKHNVSDSYYIINGSIKVTKDHEFYVNGGLNLAKTQNLQIGMMLFNGEGNIPVISIKKINKQVDVYDFVIDQYHNYFAEGVLVHNWHDPTKPSGCYLRDDNQMCINNNTCHANCGAWYCVQCDWDDYCGDDPGPEDNCDDFDNKTDCEGHSCQWGIE